MVCNRNACVYVRDQTKAAVLNGNKILETFYVKQYSVYVVLMNFNSKALKGKDS